MKNLLLLLVLIVLASCASIPNTAPYGAKYHPVPKRAKVKQKFVYTHSDKTGLPLSLYN